MRKNLYSPRGKPSDETESASMSTFLHVIGAILMLAGVSVFYGVLGGTAHTGDLGSNLPEGARGCAIGIGAVTLAIALLALGAWLWKLGG
jgi:hypothetical protein